jgi:predicted DNA-binding transcriptional regulator YafY
VSRSKLLFCLAHLLGGRRSWRVVHLARELGVTRRTVYRDLDELSACGVPVYSDERGYRLLDDAKTPPLRLDAAERAVLVLALNNPVIARQAPLAPALRSLRTKLQATSAAIEETAGALRLASVDRSGPIAGEVSEVLETGSRTGRQVRILYQSLSGNARRWRGLDPYEVFHRGEAWYVVGRCHLNDEPRTFRLDRIINAKAGDRRFQRPLDFRLERYLEDSWTVYTSSQRWDVVIHFDAALAPLIDRARHHPGERKRRLASGEIEYSARVSHLEEVARWLVGFEGKARAMAPPELRERVGELAAAVVVAHRQPARRSAEKAEKAEDESAAADKFGGAA